MLDSTAFVGRSSVLADMLDAPVAKLTVRDNVNVGEHFPNAWTLVLFKTVFEDVLYDQASSLAQSNLMPHAAQSLVDILHDLRRRVTPAQLEQLLPDVACIAVDNGLWDTTKEFVDHDCFVVLWDDIERLLDDVTAESIHTELKSLAANSIGNGDDLFRCTVLEATLDEEVPKTVNHERVRFSNDGLDKLELLLG